MATRRLYARNRTKSLTWDFNLLNCFAALRAFHTPSTCAPFPTTESRFITAEVLNINCRKKRKINSTLLENLFLKDWMKAETLIQSLNWIIEMRLHFLRCYSNPFKSLATIKRRCWQIPSSPSSGLVTNSVLMWAQGGRFNLNSDLSSSGNSGSFWAL